MISCPVVVLALALAALPLLAETPITEPGLGPAAGSQSAPVMATNGDDVFAAWLDGRGGLLAIYAARIGRDDRVLDETGVRIPVPPGATIRLVSALYAANAYVVVFTADNATYVARVSDDGRLIDGPRLLADDTAANSAATNGARIVVTSPQKLFVLDARAETVLAVSQFPNISASRVASNGTTFLVVNYLFANPASGVGLVTLDAAGNPESSSQISGYAGSGDGALIASDGVLYLIVFYDSLQARMIAQVVAGDGRPLDSSALNLPALSPASNALVWSGDRYLLLAPAASDATQLAAATLSSRGAVLDPPRILGAYERPSPAAAAWNGSRTFVTWPAPLLQRVHIVGISLSASGVPLGDARLISISSTAQSLPAIARGGTNDLVAWNEIDAVLAARVTRGGAVLDPVGLLIAFAPATSIRVAFDGSAYVVAWSDPTGLYAQRIDGGSGALVGGLIKLTGPVSSFDVGRDDIGVLFVFVASGRVAAQHLDVGGAATVYPFPIPGPVRAAWNGSEWLIVFGYGEDVLAQMVSSTLVSSVPLLLGFRQVSAEPIVASDGRDFLVAWSNLACRVGADDAPIGNPFMIGPRSASARDAIWDGAHYAVAYTLQRADGFTHELLLTHVDINDRIPISTASPDQREIVLAAPGRALYTRLATEPQYGGVSRLFLEDLGAPPRPRPTR